ncbi:MAG: EamA family transporter [Chloroflexi bacterium]|nr:EamA family transporter [Chloroflexota bacterium]
MSEGVLFLALHVCGTVSFGHIVKWALRRGHSLTAVGAVNYTVAALFSGLAATASGTTGLVPGVAIVAAIGGLSYIVSYFIYVQTIRLVGVSISMTTVRLSVLPAIAGSVLLWREALSPAQAVGVALCLLSLPLLSFQPGDKSARLGGPVWLWLLALFAVTSGGPLAARIFQQIGAPEAKTALLACWFGVSAAGAVLVLCRQRLGARRADFPIGLLLGGVNVVGNYGLLAALERLPGAIVFPVSSAGGVLLVTVTSGLLWGERLGRPAAAGVLLSTLALALVNGG